MAVTHADGADIFHANSVEVDGMDAVVSMRHTNAVYRIDTTDGEVEWKLGGTSHPERLTTLGDPTVATSLFVGQHDARLLPDGSLTVFDNGGTGATPPRAPRGAC